jgi:hypothetical protein
MDDVRALRERLSEVEAGLVLDERRLETLRSRGADAAGAERAVAARRRQRDELLELLDALGGRTHGSG